MRCIVKGCEEEVFKSRLCKDHYDPEAPQAEEGTARGKSLSKQALNEQHASRQLLGSQDSGKRVDIRDGNAVDFTDQIAIANTPAFPATAGQHFVGHDPR